MAEPRVFVSSTYHDLSNIRADLEQFIQEMGYAAILHERGNVPYDSKHSPEDACYREIERCDMLVAIVGGKRGTPASSDDLSVSQKELRIALGLGMPVFIFVHAHVLVEYQTWRKNREAEGIVKYAAVDDPQVYEFIDALYGLPRNNAIFPFETARDITYCLKQQWAGTFQRLLQASAGLEERSLASELNVMITQLRDTVFHLSESATVTGKELLLQDIVQTMHPLFTRLRTLLEVPYRVFFVNRQELDAWLRAARRLKPVDEDLWDDPNIAEWLGRTREDGQDWLKIHTCVFEDHGQLRVFGKQDWDDDWVAFDHYVSYTDDDLYHFGDPS